MQMIRVFMTVSLVFLILLSGCSEDSGSSASNEKESAGTEEKTDDPGASDESTAGVEVPASESVAGEVLELDPEAVPEGTVVEENDPEKAALELKLKMAEERAQVAEDQVSLELKLKMAEERAQLAEAQVKETEERAQLAEAQVNAGVGEIEEMNQEDTLKDKVIGIIVQNKCLRSGNVKPERLGTLQKEILDAMGMTGAEFADARDRFKAVPGFRESVMEGMNSCPEFDPEDLVLSTEPSRKTEIREKGEKPNSDKSGQMKGKLYGSASGTLMLSFTKGKITSGNVILPGRAFSLRGNFLANGRLNLLSNQGTDSFRAFGKKQKTGVVSGNWIAHIGGKVKKGSFIVK